MNKVSALRKLNKLTIENIRDMVKLHDITLEGEYRDKDNNHDYQTFGIYGHKTQYDVCCGGMYANYVSQKERQEKCIQEIEYRLKEHEGDTNFGKSLLQ